MDLLLAEDLMLLLLDDETGAVRQTHVRPLLGGAVLADLALAGAGASAELADRWGALHLAGDPVTAATRLVERARDLLARQG